MTSTIKLWFAAALAVALTGCGTFAKPTTQEDLDAALKRIASNNVDSALDIIEREIAPAAKTVAPKAPAAAETQTGTASKSAEPPTAAPDAPVSAEHEAEWIDNVDVEKILTNPWLVAVFFLLIQWFEIWYYNRTGKTSKTIDAAEAAMNCKLGIMQKVLYRLWRWRYFQKHPELKNPDKPEEKEKK